MSETKAEYQARMGRKFDRLSAETTRLINENQRLRAELSKARPAADAAIAEIKAQGVDGLIADRKSEWMDSYCEDAAVFAANLRAGRKG